MGNTFGRYTKDKYTIADVQNASLVEANTGNKKFVEQVEQIIKNKEYTLDDYTKIKMPKYDLYDYELCMIYNYIRLLMEFSQTSGINDIRSLGSVTVHWCDRCTFYYGQKKNLLLVAEHIRNQTNMILTKKEGEKVKIYQKQELIDMLSSVEKYNELENNLKKNLYTKSELDDMVNNLKILMVEKNMVTAMQLYNCIKDNQRQKEMNNIKHILPHLNLVKYAQRPYVNTNFDD